MRQEYEKLAQAINTYAWDGKWYMRALSQVENIGSKDSDGSKIYLNAQTWAVLAEIVLPERMADVVASVDGMEGDFGFPLNMPAYEKYSPNVGRMSGMLQACLKMAVYIAMRPVLRFLWIVNWDAPIRQSVL